jgi:hypothetical protein
MTTNTLTRRTKTRLGFEAWLSFLFERSGQPEEVFLRRLQYGRLFRLGPVGRVYDSLNRWSNRSSLLSHQTFYFIDMAKTGRIFAMIERHSEPNTMWIATCSKEAQVGDIMASIHGVAVPLILRKDEAAAGYKLVSPTLIDLAKANGKPLKKLSEEGFEEEEFALV